MSTDPHTMRLNKFLATAGVASRRKSDDLIAAGKVYINGEIVTDFSFRVHPTDTVEVHGKAVQLPQEHVTVVMYKPRGYTTTMEDKHAKHTVADLLPKQYKHLRPAGRLDKESEGMLIFSSDGDFIQQLMHPSYEKEKEYVVECEKEVTEKALEQMRTGIELEEGKTLPAKVEQTGPNTFSIVLKQGWKRQIRRMVKVTGNSVTMLKRVRVGKLSLEHSKLAQMQPGELREVDKEDIL